MKFIDGATEKLGEVVVLSGITLGEDTSGRILLTASGGGAGVLDDLTDVTATAHTDGFVLRGDGAGSYIEGYLQFADLASTPTTLGGYGVTDVAASLLSGTIATARLGTGTASSSTYLRGDQTWQAIASGAPVAATYVTQTADGTLTNEFALGSLASGLLAVTTTTGALASVNAGNRVPTAYLGSGTASSSTFLRGDQTWQTLGAGVAELDDLSDVTLTSESSGQVLRYNSSVWVNATLAFADIGSKPTTLSGYGITDGVATTRTISTTSPLSGGGDLSANRTFFITTNGISNTLIRQSSALSVIGRSANSTGNVADIAAGTDGHVLRRSGTTLGFGTIPQASVDNLVTDLAGKLNLTGGTLTGNLLFSADDTHSIGAAGATRPASIYAGTQVVIGTDPGGSMPLRTATGMRVGTLGDFDGAGAAPTDRQFLVYDNAASQWKPRTVQLSFAEGDVRGTIVDSETTANYVDDGRTVDSSPANASVAAYTPDVTPIYKGFIIDMGAYSLPADKLYRLEYMETGGTWGTPDAKTDEVDVCFTSATKVVHSGHDLTKTYEYRFSSWDGTSSGTPSTISTGNAPSDVAEINAFGIILASQLSVSKLVSITQYAGWITAESILAQTLTVDESFASEGSATFLKLQVAEDSGSAAAWGATVNAVRIDGPTISLTGTQGETDGATLAARLGDHSITVGTPPAPQSAVAQDSWAANSPSVGAGVGTWAVASSQPLIVPDTELESYNGYYQVTGSYTLATSSLNAPTATELEGQVLLEYQWDSSGWSTPQIIVAEGFDVQDGPTYSLNYNWSHSQYIAWPGGSPSTLSFRLTYRAYLHASKIISGSATLSGAGTNVTWASPTSGTVLGRRNLYLGAEDSQPQITFEPLTGTMPNTSTATDGEMWYNGTANSLQMIMDGTVVTLGSSTGGVYAPKSSTYVTLTTDTGLDNEFALSSLGTGLLRYGSGTLTIATGGDLPSHNHAAGDITSGTIATARLGSGTASSSTYLRGDQTWQAISGGAPVGAKYIVQQADGTLTDEQALGALATGLLKNTTTTGVLTIATASDYVAPARTISTTSPLAGGGDLSANLTFSINNNGISNALLRTSAALSVIGRSVNSTGNVADIAAGTDGHVLRRSGTTLGFGLIPESSVTNLVSDLALKAPLASPTFTGTPAAPTATGGTNTTQIATTAFVTSAISTASGNYLPITGGTLTGNLLFSTDNTRDIGAAGATRPRSIYLGTSLQIGSTPATTGAIRLTNNQSIYFRNTANDGNLRGLFLSSGDNLHIGDAAVVANVFNATNYHRFFDSTIAYEWARISSGNTRFGYDTQAATQAVYINAAATNEKWLAFQTASVNRWILRSRIAEAGSDSGSDLELLARTDAGGPIDSPLTITRAAGGNVTFNRPTLAPTATAGTATTQLATTEFVRYNLNNSPPGQNLVRNGTGEREKEYNWSTTHSTFVIDTADVTVPIGTTYWETSTNGVGVQWADEPIPVDPNESYDFSIWVKQAVVGSGGTNYAGFGCLDAQLRHILPYNVYCASGSVVSDTTLAADVDGGDTTITLTDASAFPDESGGIYNTYIHLNVQDDGSDLPNFESYRYYSKSGNVLTLTPAPAIPGSGLVAASGTKVRFSRSSGNYHYMFSSAVGSMPTDWARQYGYVSGLMPLGTSTSTSYFWTGTKYILPMMYPLSGGTGSNTVRYADLRITKASTDTHIVGTPRDSGVFTAANGGTGLSPYTAYYTLGAQKGLVGVAKTTDNLVTGATTGDFVIRSNTQIIMSADGGSSKHFRVAGTSYTGDLNDAVTSGFYRMNIGNANTPNGWNYGQMVVSKGGDTVTQIYGDYLTGKLATRSGNPPEAGGSGDWSEWATLGNEIELSAGDVGGGTVDGTTVTYFGEGVTTGTEVSCAGYDPILTAIYEGVVIDMSDFTLPADTVYRLEYKAGSGGTWTEIVNNTLGNKVVQGDLDSAVEYYYRFKNVGSGGGAAAWSNEASIYPLDVPSISTFGIVLANQISVAKLSAITTVIGVANIDTATMSAATINTVFTSEGSNVFRKLKVKPAGGYDVAAQSLELTTVTAGTKTGSTLLVRGLAGETDGATVAAVLGNHSVFIGTITPQTDSTWSTNSPSIQAGNNTYAEASSLPTNTLASPTPSWGTVVDGQYTVNGSWQITNSSINASGWGGSLGLVLMSYSIDGGAYSSDEVVSNPENLQLSGSENGTFSYAFTPSSTPTTSLAVRLKYQLAAYYTKLFSGTSTLTGSGTSVTWGESAGTSHARRGLYLAADTSKPHLTLQPLTSTQPTTSNSVEGEIWYDGTAHSLKYITNSAVMELGSNLVTTTSYATNAGVYGAVTLASVADVRAETAGTAKVAQLSDMHYHPGMAKFWVKFTGNSTTINDSYNMTSITDGTTVATLTIATDFANASWTVSATAIASSTVSATNARLATCHSMAAGSIVVYCVNAAATPSLQDPTSWCVVGFGDH